MLRRDIDRAVVWPRVAKLAEASAKLRLQSLCGFVRVSSTWSGFHRNAATTRGANPSAHCAGHCHLAHYGVLEYITLYLAGAGDQMDAVRGKSVLAGDMFQRPSFSLTSWTLPRKIQGGGMYYTLLEGFFTSPKSMESVVAFPSLTSVTAQEKLSVHYGVLDDVSTFAPAGHSIYSAHYGVLEKYLDPTFHLRSTSWQRFLVSAGFLYIFGHFAGEQLKDGGGDDDEMGETGRQSGFHRLYSWPLSPDSTRALGKLLGTRPVSYQVHVGRGFLGKASRSVPWSWFLCQVRHCKPVSEVRISERVSLSEFIALRSRRGRCIALSPSLTTPSGVTAELGMGEAGLLCQSSRSLVGLRGGALADAVQLVCLGDGGEGVLWGMRIAQSASRNQTTTFRMGVARGPLQDRHLLKTDGCQA
ncbi:hypothetical protein C8R43DRAFT_950583 [Mycena crocata]|nr:hypothetical protein C8R43DRAFT_950583 [Mycena crocata]